MQNWICCPDSIPVNEENERREQFREFQQLFYTNYGHSLGLKSQVLGMPSGMVDSLYFVSVIQNDKGALNTSVLEENLQQLLTPRAINDDVHLPDLYADAIYNPSIAITTRNGNAGLLHNRMDSSRESIEHLLGLGPLLNKRLSQKHTWKLLILGVRAKYHLFTIYFFVNCHTCFNHNKISLRYNLDPPDVNYYDGDFSDECILGLLQTEQCN